MAKQKNNRSSSTSSRSGRRPPPAAGAAVATPPRPPQPPRGVLASRCNPRPGVPDWNFVVPAVTPARYGVALRPGIVTHVGTSGTHIGNNSYVLYDGRRVDTISALAGIQDVFPQMSSHAVNEIAKGILLENPAFALNRTAFRAELRRQCCRHVLPATHPVNQLSIQDFMDMESGGSMNQISSAIGLMVSRDAQVEVRDQQTWWDARGHRAVTRAQRCAAYDRYAASKWAAASQIAVATAVRADELRLNRLAPRSVRVAPAMTVVRTNGSTPTRTRIQRAHATAVLRSV